MNEPTRVFINRCEGPNRSILLHLQGTRSNRNAVGAVLSVQIGDQSQTKYVTAGSTSVHSAQPFGVHIGVGLADTIDRLIVRWPSGDEEQFESIPLKPSGLTRYVITEGSGEWSEFQPRAQPQESSN